MAKISHLMDHVRAEAELENQSATPLYLRVQRGGIERVIRKGLVEVEDALPAEREMAGALVFRGLPCATQFDLWLIKACSLSAAGGQAHLSRQCQVCHLAN